MRAAIHSLRRSIVIACSTWLSIWLAGAAGFSMQRPNLSPPATLTAEQDHRRMMELLHISALRPGANPNDPQAPNAVNYDEAKANPYPHLPDPLALHNGRRVKTAKEWWTKRRPEIVEDFDREIYGRVPKATPKVMWAVTSTTRELNGDVPVITKKLIGRVELCLPAHQR